MDKEVRDWLITTFGDTLEAEIKLSPPHIKVEPDIFFWLSGGNVLCKVNDKPFQGLAVMNVPSDIKKQAKWLDAIE